MKFLARLLVALALALYPIAVPAQILTQGAGAGGFGGFAVGQPTGFTIPSTTWTSITDLVPVVQYVDGFTGDLVFNATTPAGVTTAYTPGTYASPKFAFNVVRPGYSCTGSGCTLGTVSAQTVSLTSWLRETQPNYTTPTEAANSGNAKTAWTISDLIYHDDTVGSATALSGLYVSGAVTSTAATVPVTNNSSLTYQPPIMAWVTPPMRRVDGTGDTVEIVCGHPLAQGGKPCAGVKFIRTDGTHSITKYVASATQSAVLLSFSCTATNGSNVLTSCGSTAGVIDGMRFTVPGIPGQAKLLSHTSTSLTFGQTTTCTPTTGGAETISATPGDGESLADGGFVGQTITDAHLNGGVGTIVAPVGTGSTSGSSTTITLGHPSSGQWTVGAWVTGTNIPANDYLTAVGANADGSGTATLNVASTGTVSGNVTGGEIGAAPASALVTSVSISTSATSGTASSGSCTINHNYTGTTGTVTATPGNPVPVYSATFSSSDYSGAGLSDGVVWTEAVGYPVVGDVTTDTQLGADGTRCDWFYINVNSGVCNSSSAAWFNINGTDLTPNLHNLSAYLDAAGKYKPVYVWVGSGGSCTTKACASTSAADPTGGGATAYASSPYNAALALKDYYNSHASTCPGASCAHNDPMGGVICILASGSPYTGAGGDISSLETAGISKPSLRFTSVLSGSSCPATGAAGSDPQNVNLAYNTSNTYIAGWNDFANVTMSGTNWTVRGNATTSTNAFQTTEGLTFESDKFYQTGSNPTLFKMALWYAYNVIADDSTYPTYLLAAYSSTTGAPGLIAGSTLICGIGNTTNSNPLMFNSAGNDGWGCAPSSPNTLDVINYNIQPISQVYVYDKWMANRNSVFFQGVDKNLLFANELVESKNIGVQGTLYFSGDGVNIPLTNVAVQYTGAYGQRSNVDYLEGDYLGNGVSVTSTGGSLTTGAGTSYYIQGNYALLSGSGCSATTTPCAESSTDGGATTAIASGGTGSTGSISLAIPCDPNYSVTLYLDTASGANHYAGVAAGAKLAAGGTTSAGQDAVALAMCQTVTITKVGTAHTNPNPSVGHNEPKMTFVARFNMFSQQNTKNDTYNGSATTPNGARVGNWPFRWGASSIGNVAITGTAIGSGYGPQTALGEIACRLCSYNSTNSTTDLSWVTFKSDRSQSVGVTSYPSLNIGEGNYCLAATTPHGYSLVPSGLASWPWDIQGNTRLNDGTGAAGPYEKTCS